MTAYYIYLSDEPAPHCGSHGQKNLTGNTFSFWFKVVCIKGERVFNSKVSPGCLMKSGSFRSLLLIQSENIQENWLLFPQAVRTEARSKASGQSGETVPWVCLWVLCDRLQDLLWGFGGTTGDEIFKQRSEKRAERMWLRRGCLPPAKSSRGESVRVLCEKLYKTGNEEERCGAKTARRPQTGRG